MAYEKDDGGGAYGSVVEVGEGGGVDVLVGGGGFADGDAGGFGGDAGLDEVVGEGAEVAAGHVDDQGSVFGEGTGPFGGDFELAGGVMGGGEDELRGRGAVGKGRAKVGGYGEGGGDAGDDLEGDVVFVEKGYLFACAAEDEGVAGFETKDGAAVARMVEHEGVDLGLGDTGLAAALANGDDLGCGAGEGEDFIGDEVVGEDDVGGLEKVHGVQGEEAGVARACAYEVDGARLGFFVHDFFPGSGLARACSRAKVREGHWS